MDIRISLCLCSLLTLPNNVIESKFIGLGIGWRKHTIMAIWENCGSNTQQWQLLWYTLGTHLRGPLTIPFHRPDTSPHPPSANDQWLVSTNILWLVSSSISLPSSPSTNLPQSSIFPPSSPCYPSPQPPSANLRRSAVSSVAPLPAPLTSRY